MQEQLIKQLQTLFTEERLAAFERVLQYRTNYFTIVLEDIYQPFNASAVMRTCDCYGIQNLHVIENENQYELNPYVSVGAAKWVDVNKYNTKQNNTKDCISTLKQKGYRVVATSPHASGYELKDIDIEKGPIALMFGTEKLGLSDVAMEHADEYVKIPMFGFTESFNISVSAALFLNHMTTLLHQSNINYVISEEEKDALRLKWMEGSLKNGDKIVQGIIQKLRLG